MGTSAGPQSHEQAQREVASSKGQPGHSSSQTTATPLGTPPRPAQQLWSLESWPWAAAALIFNQLPSSDQVSLNPQNGVLILQAHLQGRAREAAGSVGWLGQGQHPGQQAPRRHQEAPPSSPGLPPSCVSSRGVTTHVPGLSPRPRHGRGGRLTCPLQPSHPHPACSSLCLALQLCRLCSLPW